MIHSTIYECDWCKRLFSSQVLKTLRIELQEKNGWGMTHNICPDCFVEFEKFSREYVDSARLNDSHIENQ